jgi:hypothetical protein
MSRPAPLCLAVEEGSAEASKYKCTWRVPRAATVETDDSGPNMSACRLESWHYQAVIDRGLAAQRQI